MFEVYYSTLERLLSACPSIKKLSTKFIEGPHLTYTVLKRHSDQLENTLLHVDDALSTLESSVLRIAYQLSAFPFPSHALPPLPIQLINVAKKYASQMKYIVNAGHASTWWDNIIPDSTVPKNSLLLPAPPTGSFDLHQKSISGQCGKDSIWSEKKYQYAISSAKCLETSILFLMSRVHFVALRDTRSVSLDPVAIAKGICRCSDASRVRPRSTISVI